MSSLARLSMTVPTTAKASRAADHAHPFIHRPGASTGALPSITDGWLQVPFCILPLMQNTNHVQTVGGVQEIDHMRAAQILLKAR